jgi:hypothetical protein
MRRTLVTTCIAALSFLAFAAAALGVQPKKGGVYVGDVKASPFTMHVSLGVTPTGTKTRFTYLCGTGRPPTIVFGILIDKTGRFHFNGKHGAWKMTGKFISPTKARVSLNSIACGGSKGSTTAKLK